jgi:hypothetical protein
MRAGRVGMGQAESGWEDASWAGGVRCAVLRCSACLACLPACLLAVASIRSFVRAYDTSDGGPQSISEDGGSASSIDTSTSGRLRNRPNDTRSRAERASSASTLGPTGSKIVVFCHVMDWVQG